MNQTGTQDKTDKDDESDETIIYDASEFDDTIKESKNQTTHIQMKVKRLQRVN